jgi:hypothetical protein
MDAARWLGDGCGCGVRWKGEWPEVLEQGHPCPPIAPPHPAAAPRALTAEAVGPSGASGVRGLRDRAGRRQMGSAHSRRGGGMQRLA